MYYKFENRSLFSVGFIDSTSTFFLKLLIKPVITLCLDVMYSGETHVCSHVLLAILVMFK